MTEEEKKRNIENHLGLLDEELREIVDHIFCDIIVYHRLDFIVFETLRNPERQKFLFESGVSKTLNSRHLPNTHGKSEAIDLVYRVNGKPTWDLKHKAAYDFLGYKVLDKYGDKLQWGGNFKNFYDAPHFQLTKTKNPVK